MSENSEVKVKTLNLTVVETDLKNMTKSGSYTRDELRMEMVLSHRCPPTQTDKILKKIGISFGKTGTYGYRHWTAEQFKKNPKLSRKEWEKGVSKHLDDIKNYKQLYDVFFALANKEEMK